MIPYGKHNVTWGDALRVLWQIRFRSLTQGAQIEKFEEEVAKAVGAKYAVAVSSATAGLHLAALVLNLPSGSKVITSPISLSHLQTLFYTQDISLNFSISTQIR